MIVPLTKADAAAETTTTAAVGGKASSLAKLYSIAALREHVPKSYALSTAFFQPWMDIIKKGNGYSRLITSSSSTDTKAIEKACEELKQICLDLPLNASQEQSLKDLSNKIATEFNHDLAAVRSSAIEEDGSDLSYAGMFETKLGVTSSKLEWAVRHCFASKFDYRVVSYTCNDGKDEGSGYANDGFALVVMEMIDSVIAGAAFTANPLNSDRDECVVDSSWGLGESVVDGSVTADRFIYDKVQDKMIDKIIGNKKVERRLNLAEGGGVDTIAIDDDDRQNACSLADEQLKDLVRLTCIVEKEYDMPMDVEWGITSSSQLVLLQARPITTLFYVDPNMMTEPGERRILYYDSNVIADATTTNPFTHLDMSLYCRASVVIGGMPEDTQIFKYDPNMPYFNGQTRQYNNFSIYFKFVSPEYFAKSSMLLDPYSASIFASKDCNRDKYRMKKLPKGVNLRNAWWLFRQVPIMKLHKIGKKFKKDPEKEKLNYIQVVKEDMARLKELEARGYSKEDGLHQYSHELFLSIMPSMELEMGLIFFVVLGTYKALDKKRRDSKSEEVRSEYDALCQGYEGDELMEINIAMYRLARKLDASIWEEYDYDQLHQLSERIQMNLDGVISDLPSDFVSEWSTFMENFGWDRADQMFISSPSYRDDPVLLLSKLRQNVGTDVKDPAITQQEQAAKRRQVMQLHEERAASKFTSSKSKVQKRNNVIEHLMWIRNAPKLHISQMLGVLRINILRAEEDLIAANRLEAKNDIFHLDLEEVDKGLKDESYDLMAIVTPRKAVYERARKSNQCPILFDSRCRILRPDPPSQEGVEEGTLVGAAVSPGTATGRVRIVHSPNDCFERGEVLAATVTNPNWTPLFVGASAVILQIGGALQHGALCARELGKPAVSNIDIHNVLKTGMMVIVDGNAGTVKIVDEAD